jgi:leader peptidase (prepilin peptidase) / N-methyltransferase
MVLSMLATDIPASAVRLGAFLFGALWGSFFNVAIHRWPRGMSVISPPSHCPACGAAIPAWRNLPIVGWLLLRGRAACCGAPVSPRYPLVELLGASLCLALAEILIVRAGPDMSLGQALLELLAYYAFAGALVIATFVDLEWMQIPDEVSLPGTAIGLVTVPLRALPGAVDAAVGAGMGFLLVQMVFVWAYERLTGRRGMGEGDAKLLMMIGAFLGWRGVLFSLVAGSLQGLVVAVGARLTGRRLGPTASMDSAGFEERMDELDASLAPNDGTPGQEGPMAHMKLPFGPLLALGALQYLFFGEVLIGVYLGLFSP